MNEIPVIILIGKTHTGKTTFARALREKIKDLVLVETDGIAIFLKEQFPDIVEAEQLESTGAFASVSLRFQLFHIILGRALMLTKPIILSNSNMWKEGRRLVINECKKMNRSTIGIHLDLPLEILRERTEKSSRDTRVLKTSRHFAELLERQETRFQAPDPAEFDEFIIVHTPDESNALLKKLAERLS